MKKENKKVTAKTTAKKTTSKKSTSKKVTTAKTTSKAKAPATKTAPKKSTVKKAASTQASKPTNKKEDVLRRKGIKLRRVNKNDKQAARTTYQRNANYIIITSNKEQYFSTNGSLKDCLWAENDSKRVKNNGK